MKKIFLLFLTLAISCLGFFCFQKTNTKEFVFTKTSTVQKENQKPEENKTVSIIAVGDVMLSRNVGSKMKKYKNYDYPFLKTRDYLKTGDIVFGNLETSITPGRAIKTNEMSFRADVETAIALKNAGFTILSLANNHTPNFGEKGLKDTFSYLDKSGVKYVGAGKNSEEAKAPAYIEANGLKFAFLAYNDSDVVPSSYEAGANSYGTNFMDISKMQEAVKLAKQNSNFVIVSMHSGTEYTRFPNKRQVNFAHAAIDAGAEIIIGHHPHVIQTMEKYKDKYILYSLGNFVFDQMWSQDTREGLIAKITFDKNGVKNLEFQPVLIEDYSQPKILEGKEAGRVLKKITK